MGKHLVVFQVDVVVFMVCYHLVKKHNKLISEITRCIHFKKQCRQEFRVMTCRFYSVIFTFKKSILKKSKKAKQNHPH